MVYIETFDFLVSVLMKNGQIKKMRKQREERLETGKEMVANYKQRDNVQTTPEGPGVNALGSGLIAHLRTGEHAKRVTAEELRLIGTWIDLNATFYGCYEEPCLSAQREGKRIPLPERQ